MGQELYISVILPLKLEWEPCYRVTARDADIRTGDRVRVMFAKREYLGVVSGTGIMPDTEPSRIKTILAIEREMERILPEEIDLWKRVAEYYLCSLGEVYKAAYPAGKLHQEESRAASVAKTRERMELKRARMLEIADRRLERLASRKERLNEKLTKARKDSVRKAAEEEIFKTDKEIALTKENITRLSGIEDTRIPAVSDQPRHFPEISLSDAQKEAYGQIQEGFAAGKPVLLHGITGSGKTEIYIKAAAEAMKTGRNVLYLVPEIALSKQLEERLEKHFRGSLMTFHSSETAAKKRDIAYAVRSSNPEGTGTGPYMVLGTRSSLFLPHHDIGLIIVDEEHDSSYKQDSPAPRYNGRDTALMMFQLENERRKGSCNIILGSATPSLEELYNCHAGRHHLVSLTERYHGSDDSDVEIIDTRAERRKRGMKGSISIKLIEHIRKALSKGEQVLILRSRRAWSTILQCNECGKIQKCPHCNVSLSLHKSENGKDRTVCHHCGWSTPYSGRCSHCGGALTGLGAGTQKIEDEISALFPDARTSRLDSDSAQSKEEGKRIIREFCNGETDILVGTQIVSKGFDVSRIGLVAVIGADGILGMQDFRADEKAMQLLEQFRGRCGRRDRKGLFIIQTSQPEHPIYRRIAEGNTGEFAEILLSERKAFDFPPYSRAIEISLKDRYADRAQRNVERLAGTIRTALSNTGTGYNLMGPYPPPVDKVAERNIRNITIYLPKDRKLHERKKAIKNAVESFEKENIYTGHISINVDPA